MTKMVTIVCMAGVAVGSTAFGQAQDAPPAPAPVVIQPGWQPGPNAGHGGMSGIGGTRAKIDLISSPIRNRPIVVPAPTVTIFPRPPVTFPPGYCPPAPCPPQPCPPQPCPPHRYPTPIVIQTGSGLTVGGTYSSGNWNLGFHLGSPTVVSARSCDGGPVPINSMDWRRYPSTWWYARQGYSSIAPEVSPFVGSTGTYFDPSLSGMALPVLPVVEPAAEAPRERTLIEQAAFATYANEKDQAVRLLREHLRAQPSDTRAMRVLSLALIDTRDLEGAAAVMGLAYRTDPGLANEAIAFGSAGLSESRLRGLLTRAVGFAHKVDSASAWLTVGAIMQAEGRDALARTMIERARKSGLEPAVYDALAAELR